MRTILSLMAVGSGPVLRPSSHPNEMRFEGVLLRLDEPSTKPPHGSQGHRIMIRSDVARKLLPTLLNMGLNYSPSLEEHSQRRKVGVITKAWIDGRDLKVRGTIWKKDFPEAEQDLKRPDLGMSMEIGDVRVEDEDATVWDIIDFCFLGATILKRTAAAYYKTHAIAAAKEKQKMKKQKTTKTGVAGLGAEVTEIASAAAALAVRRVTRPLQTSLDEILENQRDFSVRLDNLEAAADLDLDAEEEKACDTEMKTRKGMKSKKAKMADDDDDEDEDDDDDDDDDVDSEIDKGDLDEMGPETGDDEDDDDETGHLNKGAKNKGRKTTSENKVGKTVASARLSASLQREQGYRRELKAAQSEIATMRAEMKTIRKQIKASGEQTDRRSVALPQEVRSLLTRGGIDVKDLQASGEPLSVEAVDSLLRNIGGLPPEKRVELKTVLAKAGLMDAGYVNRYGN